MAVAANLVTLTNGPYTIPSIGGTISVTTDFPPNAFTEGSCVVIADATPGPQPYVGQVTAQGPGNALTLRTLSPGSRGPSGTLVTGATLAFGSTSTGWTSGQNGTAFPLKVFWATDPTIYSNPAIGDGVHDDAPAINNALTLAAATPAGGIVMLPAGTFLCNETLIVGTASGGGVHLWGVGRGATVLLQGMQASSTFPSVVEVTGAKCSVRYLTIQGLESATPLGTSPGNNTSGTGWALLFTGGASSSSAYEVHVESTFHGIGVAPNGSGSGSTIQVERCTVHNPYGTYCFYAQGSVAGL